MTTDIRKALMKIMATPVPQHTDWLIAVEAWASIVTDRLEALERTHGATAPDSPCVHGRASRMTCPHCRGFSGHPAPSPTPVAATETGGGATGGAAGPEFEDYPMYLRRELSEAREALAAMNVDARVLEGQRDGYKAERDTARAELADEKNMRETERQETAEVDSELRAEVTRLMAVVRAYETVLAHTPKSVAWMENRLRQQEDAATLLAALRSRVAEGSVKP